MNAPLPVADLRTMETSDPRRRLAYDAGFPRSWDERGLITLHMVNTHWYFDGLEPANESEVARIVCETCASAAPSGGFTAALVVVDRYGCTVVGVRNLNEQTRTRVQTLAEVCGAVV